MQLNAAKTEFVWFAFRSNLAKISSEYRCLAVASSTIHCAHTVRNIGVKFDSELVPLPGNNAGQVVYTHVPLSPSSII